MNTLEAINLAKSYKKKQVVKDVSLSINSNEIIGLLGPNGAGKTTSFYMIVGLIVNDHGDVRLNNKSISSLPLYARAKMGISYLPQEASIFRKLSVADNIRAILQLRKELTPVDIESKLDSLLQEFHIGHLRENIAASLSGGERRRVEIARALAIEPKFVLLDEPFAGIDPISVLDIKHIISHLKQRDIGVLITDHNVRETLGICDRAYIVSEGKIICEGSSEEVLNNQQVREVYLGHEFYL